MSYSTNTRIGADETNADWSVWKDIPQAQLYEAVALSMDIEPEKLPGLNYARVAGDCFDDCSDDFKRRLKIACAQIEAGKLDCEIRSDATRTCTVSLARFALWARDLGWKLPTELSAIAADPTFEKLSSASDRPLATNERNTLLIIIAAICDYSDIKHQERGAAAQIAKLTDELGASVTDDTIIKFLKKIPDAIQSRKK